MGWVKERYDYDNSMDSGVPLVWAALKTSLQTAGDEFRDHFGQAEASVIVRVINPNLVYILVHRGSTDETIEVSLHNGTRQIATLSSYPRTNSKLGFALDSGGTVGLSMDGKLITIEQASRMLLEPLLFPI